MRVVRESGAILIIGTCLGVSLGIVRGFPAAPARPDEGMCHSPDPSQPEIQWVSQEDAHDLLGQAGVVFVDARSEDEYENGHVAGAIHMPIETGTLPDGAESTLAGARTIVAYCDTSNACARSTRLAGLLSMAGFPDVRVLRGGLQDWIEHGYPAEAGSCRLCP